MATGVISALEVCGDHAAPSAPPFTQAGLDSARQNDARFIFLSFLRCAMFSHAYAWNPCSKGSFDAISNHIGPTAALWGHSQQLRCRLIRCLSVHNAIRHQAGRCRLICHGACEESHQWERNWVSQQQPQSISIINKTSVPA